MSEVGKSFSSASDFIIIMVILTSFLAPPLLRLVFREPTAIAEASTDQQKS